MAGGGGKCHLAKETSPARLLLLLRCCLLAIWVSRRGNLYLSLDKRFWWSAWTETELNSLEIGGSDGGGLIFKHPSIASPCKPIFITATERERQGGVHFYSKVERQFIANFIGNLNMIPDWFWMSWIYSSPRGRCAGRRNRADVYKNCNESGLYLFPFK